MKNNRSNKKKKKWKQISEAGHQENQKKNRKKEETIFDEAHKMKFVKYERENMENENKNSNKIDSSLRRAKIKIEKYGAIIRNK